MSQTGIITQQQFDAAAEQWQLLQADPTGLAQLFGSKSSQLAFAPFTLDQIVGVLSAVGVMCVNARFLVLPDDKGKQSFAVGFFASDFQNQPLTACYVAFAVPASTTVATGESLKAELPGGQVNHGLAKQWIDNWQAISQATPAMFKTMYGTLKGYSFRVGDILDPLFGAPEMDDPKMTLRADFGLHQYYSPTGELTQTFGLIMRLNDSSQQQSTAPFYDMTCPCPPICGIPPND